MSTFILVTYLERRGVNCACNECVVEVLQGVSVDIYLRSFVSLLTS